DRGARQRERPRAQTRAGAAAERRAGARRSRVKLGRIGVWSFRFVQDPLPIVREAVERIEELGYTAVWYPETPLTREAVLEAALLLGWTRSVAVCSGIAPIWNR